MTTQVYQYSRSKHDKCYMHRNDKENDKYYDWISLNYKPDCKKNMPIARTIKDGYVNKCSIDVSSNLRQSNIRLPYLKSATTIDVSDYRFNSYPDIQPISFLYSTTISEEPQYIDHVIQKYQRSGISARDYNRKSSKFYKGSQK